MSVSNAPNSEQEAYALRQSLVDQLRQDRAIRTRRVEAAFRAVPRHLFVPGVALVDAYKDHVIPTKQQDDHWLSAASQPSIVAIMLEQLDLKAGHRVLEIGAGTGYNAALMAHIVGSAGRVVTLDIDEDIVQAAREHLTAAGVSNVQAICADGVAGYADAAPYDRIILTVASWDIAPAWRDQLKDGGRLVLPLEIMGDQKAVAFEKHGGVLISLSISPCMFMEVRGPFAKLDTDVRLALGPPPEIVLQGRIPITPGLDPQMIYSWLTVPSPVFSTGLETSWHDIAYDFISWLSVREPALIELYSGTDSAIQVPYLSGQAGKFTATDGLLGEHGLAVLMRPPGAMPSADGSDGKDSFALCVRGFGPDAPVSQLIGYVSEWNAAGRPHSNKMHLRSYPLDSDYQPAASERMLIKRWSKLIVDWA